MVANSIRTIGIIVACVIALILIGIAFLISGPLPSLLPHASAESTHDLLVQYASKDSDNDGLPDWEEALYGTDPNNPHSISPTLTDGQAVAQGLATPKFANATSTPVDASSIPGPTVATSTLTDQFAKDLFGQYFQNLGTSDPTPDQIATFVEQGVSQLEASQQRTDAFNAGQVTVRGSGPDALAAYATAVETALAKTQVTADRSDLESFSDAANKGDMAALKNVRAYSAAYAQMAHSLMQVPVPQEASNAHLELANALMHMSQATADMGALDTDPLRAMLGLGEYENAAAKMIAALKDLHVAFQAENVSVPGDFFGSTVVAGKNT